MNKKQITLVCFHCGTKAHIEIDTSKPYIEDCTVCGCVIYGAVGEDP